MNNSVVLYSNQSVDCILLNSEPFLADEIQALKRKTKYSDLNWSDFRNAEILCDFKSNLTSSFIEGLTGELVGFDVRKRRPSDNFYTSVVFIPLSKLEELTNSDNLYYSIIDYNIANNSEYIYTIFPVTSDAIGISLENRHITYWNYYTLTPLNQVSENNFIAHEDQVWSFLLNCEESEISHVQDKTKFTTFAKKPKISVGDLDYYEGSFKCLLGNILCGGQYYEPYDILQKWNSFIESNSICLFKNLKGDVRIIALENNTLSYMNSVFEVPTNISFSYTEILDVKDISIYKIGSE